MYLYGLSGASVGRPTELIRYHEAYGVVHNFLCPKAPEKIEFENCPQPLPQRKVAAKSFKRLRANSRKCW